MTDDGKSDATSSTAAWFGGGQPKKPPTGFGGFAKAASVKFGGFAKKAKFGGFGGASKPAIATGFNKPPMKTFPPVPRFDAGATSSTVPPPPSTATQSVTATQDTITTNLLDDGFKALNKEAPKPAFTFQKPKAFTFQPKFGISNESTVSMDDASSVPPAPQKPIIAQPAPSMVSNATASSMPPFQFQSNASSSVMPPRPSNTFPAQSSSLPFHFNSNASNITTPAFPAGMQSVPFSDVGSIGSLPAPAEYMPGPPSLWANNDEDFEMEDDSFNLKSQVDDDDDESDMHSDVPPIFQPEVIKQTGQTNINADGVKQSTFVFSGLGKERDEDDDPLSGWMEREKARKQKKRKGGGNQANDFMNDQINELKKMKKKQKKNTPQKEETDETTTKKEEPRMCPHQEIEAMVTNRSAATADRKKNMRLPGPAAFIDDENDEKAYDQLVVIPDDKPILWKSLTWLVMLRSINIPLDPYHLGLIARPDGLGKDHPFMEGFDWDDEAFWDSCLVKNSIEKICGGPFNGAGKSRARLISSMVVYVKHFERYPHSAFAVVADPTGQMGCCVHPSVFEVDELSTKLDNDGQLVTKQFSDIAPGTVMFLRDVTVFSASYRAHYLLITKNSLVHFSFM